MYVKSLLFTYSDFRDVYLLITYLYALDLLDVEIEKDALKIACCRLIHSH